MIKSSKTQIHISDFQKKRSFIINVNDYADICYKAEQQVSIPEITSSILLYHVQRVMDDRW